MTRDEAIKIVSAQVHFNSSAERMVNLLSDLGLLKFDEPKSYDQRVNEALQESLYLVLGPKGGLPVVASGIIFELEKRGFKIVEKD